MTNNKISPRFGIIVLLVLLAAAVRFLLLPMHNFSPIGGMALFGAAYFTKKYWAFIIPFVAMWVSDIILNNTLYAQWFDGFVWYGDAWVYVSFALIVVLGFFLLKKVTMPRLLAGSLGASVLFFIVSNFGTWASGTIYPMNIAGLIACYEMALPFFQNTLVSDLLFVSILFGSFELVKNYYPNVALEQAK